MNIRDFYLSIGGDYDEVLGRLVKEERIVKYLKKFADTDPLSDFLKAYEKFDCEEAFRTTHSLKGMCQNLGFVKLEKSISALCEEFRHGKPEKDVTPLVESALADYKNVIDSINELNVPNAG